MSDGSRDSDKRVEEIPERIGRYRPLSLLGSGGMGVVYRALDPDGHRVALKVMRREHANDLAMTRRFIREASGGASLYHPHIVRFLDFGEAEGRYYIAMELVEGVTLWDWIPHAPHGAIVRRIIDQILSALAYAHARGVVHRDLKPENILVEIDGYGEISARLMDFGIVHFRDESLGEHNENDILGTPEYLSPEQAIASDRVSPASDIYAVGILIWELLTGQPPFSGQNSAETIRAHLEGPRPLFVPRRVYDISGPIESVLDRFLAREPEKRFAFSIDAQRAFSECHIDGGTPLEELPLKKPEPEAPEPTGRDRALKPRPGIYAISEAPYQNVRPELQSLLDFAENTLREGQVRFIILTGAAGVGKSRLLHELCGELEEAGLMQAWIGHADATGSPIVAATEALQRGFRIYGLPPERAKQRLRDIAIRQGIDDPYEIDAFIAIVLGYESSAESRLLRRQEARIALFSRILARARRHRPVVLGLDGLTVNEVVVKTWRDFLSRDEVNDFSTIIAYSVRTNTREELDTVRAFVDSVKRSERSRHLIHRHIEALPVRSLQRILTASANVHPNVATAIASHAAGNPRDALEIIRYLSSDASVQLDTFDDAFTDVLQRLPTASLELAQRRMERHLSDDDARAGRQIFEVLASYDMAFSVEFAWRLVQSVLPYVERETLEENLTAAVAAGVLVEPRERVFRFAAPAIRDAYLERLAVAGDFQKITRAIASFEAAQQEARTFLRLVRLAERYRVGGNDLRAQELYLEAGEKAFREGRVHEARTTLERALQLTERLAGHHNHAFEANALLSLARVYIQIGKLKAATALLNRVHVDRLSTHDPAVTTHWLLRAECSRLRGRTGDVVELLRRSLKAATLSGERRLESAVRLRFGQCMLEVGRLAEAEVQVRGALAARGQGASNFHAFCFTTLGFIALYADTSNEARDYLDAAHAIYARTGQRVGLATNALLEAEIELHAGEPRAALDAYDRARRIYGELGEERNVAVAQVHRARALIELETFDLARSALSEAIDVLKRSGAIQWLSFAFAVAARVDARAQSWASASENLISCFYYDDRVQSEATLLTDELSRLARLWVFHGDYHQAVEVLRRASEKLDAIGAQTYLYRAVNEVEYLLHVVGQPDGAI